MNQTQILNQLKKAQQAQQVLAGLSDKKINQVLQDFAKSLVANSSAILLANQKDLKKMSPQDPKYDRLKLTKERVNAIAADLKNVASLPSPLNKIFDKSVRPNGLKIHKITVPLGVVAVIYEARPNVTADVFALCFKSGNAAVLKGGSDAHNSSTAIIDVLKKVLQKHKIDQNIVTLLPADRDAIHTVLNATGLVDVAIPRGGRGLIDFVRNNAKVPVIETGAGIVHTYVDETADLEMAKNIILNAKTRRVSVCNALDTLIINKKLLPKLSTLIAPLEQYNVQIFADPNSFKFLQNQYPEKLLYKASIKDFDTEFLDYKMAIKTVSSLDEAFSHIAAHSSKHSESIVSESKSNIQKLSNQVDAAAVYANAPTSFSDGGQFGLGAEIGISTQKLHARGPMALNELTSYKWIVEGNGQIRS